LSTVFGPSFSWKKWGEKLGQDFFTLKKVYRNCNLDYRCYARDAVSAVFVKITSISTLKSDHIFICSSLFPKICSLAFYDYLFD
jgi:hypothetical protein